MAEKDFEINLDYMSAQKATSDFYKNQYLSNRKPLNVSSEGNDEFRIRIGIIDNYLIDRKGTIEDPLETMMKKEYFKEVPRPYILNGFGTTII